MAYSPLAKDTVHFVLSGVGADNTNGGGCTKAAWESSNGYPSTFTGIAGGSIGGVTDDSAALTNNGSGKVRVTKAGAFDQNTPVGTLANLYDTTYDAGRYEVIAVNTNYVDLELAYVSDDTVSIKVGGAFADLQGACDDDSTDAADYNRYILTNKNETLTAAIDFDTGLGSAANNSHKVIIGFNTRPPSNTAMDDGDMDYGGDFYKSALDIHQNSDTVPSDDKVDIDADGGAWHITTIDSGRNLHLRNLYLHNCADTYNVFDITTDHCYGLNVRGCAFDTHEKIIGDSAKAARGCVFNDCFFGNPVNYNGYYFGFMYGGLIENCVFSGGNYGIKAYMTTIINSIIAGGWRGVESMYYTHLRNCTFYNQTNEAIYIANSSYPASSVKNCIFVVNDKDNDYVIRFGSSGGSIQDFSYNCYYGADGGVITTPFYNDKLSAEFTPQGMGNIIQDPLFVDAANGDYKLKPNSPCINTGKPTIGDGYTNIGAWQRKSFLGID